MLNVYGAANGCLTEFPASETDLPTDAVWFGVTYREDKPVVTEALKKLHARGAYPESLWEA